MVFAELDVKPSRVEQAYLLQTPLQALPGLGGGSVNVQKACGGILLGGRELSTPMQVHVSPQRASLPSICGVTEIQDWAAMFPCKI